MDIIKEQHYHHHHLDSRAEARKGRVGGGGGLEVEEIITFLKKKIGVILF